MKMVLAVGVALGSLMVLAGVFLAFGANAPGQEISDKVWAAVLFFGGLMTTLLSIIAAALIDILAELQRQKPAVKQ